ncbi:lipopolysaccharide transport periplasmic protein LptA [Alcaligenes sp. WGS1538]|uniref:lipopolysaccharide transport periplasmic protein LptA n=1 Tax=Alcaligenes sp. WGS1538 TaxID=3366811 RepID=UPI00372D22FA
MTTRHSASSSLRPELLTRLLRSALGLAMASAALVLLPNAPAQAQAGAEAAQEPDTSVLSDTLTYDDVTKQTIYKGNIVLTRGALTLMADQLAIEQDAEGYQHGTATVTERPRVTIRQEEPAKFELLTAEGVKAVYNGKTEEIELIGKAIVNRYVCGKLQDTIQGQRIIYRQKSGTYQAFGGAESATRDGRVRSVARSRASADAALAECQRKSSPRK